MDKHRSAVDQFGSCYSILLRTDDDSSIIHEFPPPGVMPQDWQDLPVDDDLVLSHGASLRGGGEEIGGGEKAAVAAGRFGAAAAATVAIIAAIMWIQKKRKRGYTVLSESSL